MIRLRASQPEFVHAGRACSIALALTSILVAPMIVTSGSLHNHLQKIYATFFGLMVAVTLLGMFSRRVWALAVKAGLAGGLILFFLLVFSFNNRVQSFLQGLFGTGDETHFLHFLAIVLVALVAARHQLKAVHQRQSGKRHCATGGKQPVLIDPSARSSAVQEEPSPAYA